MGSRDVREEEEIGRRIGRIARARGEKSGNLVIFVVGLYTELHRRVLFKVGIFGVLGN